MLLGELPSALEEGMTLTGIFKRADVLSYLFDIPELDVTEDLLVERTDGEWVILGTFIPPGAAGVEQDVQRQSILLDDEGFATSFSQLGEVDYVFSHLGNPTEVIGPDEYRYRPFHRFEIEGSFGNTLMAGEPLVFRNPVTPRGNPLLINPDLWLYLKLEQRDGDWWDEHYGEQVIRYTHMDKHVSVCIRAEYLMKYLRARQMSLVVGHRRTTWSSSSDVISEASLPDVVTLGSPETGAKATVRTWRVQKIAGQGTYTYRKLDLWYEIAPRAISTADLGAEPPPFDAYSFTLPTRVGPVAPARWAHFETTTGRTYDGDECAELEQVFFRQEVLSDYEQLAGCRVDDDASIYREGWSLSRVQRYGNELIGLPIVDFGQRLPLREWSHWQRYAVTPPSVQRLQMLLKEQTLPDAVNGLVEALRQVNATFEALTRKVKGNASDPLWTGSTDSYTIRRMKRVYAADADAGEFLSRATHTSTLVIDELNGSAMRKLLADIGGGLDRKANQSLGSLKLLERLMLIAVLVDELRLTSAVELPSLVVRAEGDVASGDDPQLQVELKATYERVRQTVTPLFALYELRNKGGVAHPADDKELAEAAMKIGLPSGNWSCKDYLQLLNMVRESLLQVGRRLAVAAQRLSVVGGQWLNGD